MEDFQNVYLQLYQNIEQHYINEQALQIINLERNLICFTHFRVSRVLQMPRGNILMVGLGGSGRRSSAKLAASIADAELLTIQITKTYSSVEWRDDIKRILMKAGMGMKPAVFLFSDSQVSSVVSLKTILLYLLLKHDVPWNLRY